MIYAQIRQRIEAEVPEIAGKLLPVTAVIAGDTAPPVAVYRYRDSEEARSLGGKIHHTTETIIISVGSQDYDEASAIIANIKTAMMGLVGRLETGETVISVRCYQPEEDGAVFETEWPMMQRSIAAEIVWR